MQEKLMRETVLETARNVITVEREGQYGTPADNFGLIASFWTEYLDLEITAHDVSIMMALLKLARIRTGGFNLDNYIDTCGYVALGAELGKPIAKVKPVVLVQKGDC
jgi:hypothetical protein